DERFHRTLKEELLKRSSFTSIESLQVACNQWREEYNQIRPHCALNLEVPSSRYKVSNREFKNLSPVFEYDEACHVRSVSPNGQVNFKGKTYSIGEVFKGRKVGVHETTIDGIYKIYYRHQLIKELNLKV
ncbi:integrase core domain-containing protein, partial [Paraferrimonas sp. SM1919]|uniref:integrase core domain-containing protein n=1 Tax=Paraferrimonas sp. SM1919 TaxID=2662263 RepID=UPI0013D69E4A